MMLSVHSLLKTFVCRLEQLSELRLSYMNHKLIEIEILYLNPNLKNVFESNPTESISKQVLS